MVGPEGNPLTCRFVIVGEAPGEEEVRLGRPFVGPSGRALNILLESAGIDRKDCYLTNAVKERVHDLEWAQVMASRPALIEELKQVPISVPILALGGTARDALLGIHTGGVFEGRRWYTLHTGHEMLSTLHPAYLLRDHLEQAWMVVFDLQKLEVGRRPLPVQHIRMFTSIAEANAWLDGCESTLFSFDIETDWNDFQRSTILIIGIAYAQGEIVILPDTLIYNKSVIWKGDDNPVLPEHIKPEGVDFLSRLFGDTKRKFIAHNGLYDLRFLVGQLGVRARVDYDTLLAHYVLWEDAPHGLKSLAEDYFDIPSYEKEVESYLGKPRRWRRVPRKVLCPYCALDADITYRLWTILEAQLKAENLYRRPFRFPMMKAYPMVSDAEIKGFPIDRDEMLKVEKELNDTCSYLQAQLNELVMDKARKQWNVSESALFQLTKKGRGLGGVSKLQGNDFERYKALRGLRSLATKGAIPSDSGAIQAVLFDVFKAPVPDEGRSSDKDSRQDILNRVTSAVSQAARREKVVLNTAEGQSNWLENVLEHTKFKTLPKWVSYDLVRFMSLVEEWRFADKLRTSSIANLLLGTDGAVHPSYKLHGTVSGRLSATEPAIQTIPRDTGLGMKVSGLFTIPTGYKIVDADYSQCELRAAAHLSGDRFMIEAFRSGKDVHGEVATSLYGEDYSREQRTLCKRIVFKWLFGGDLLSTAMKTHSIPEEAARRFAEQWERTMPEMSKYREGLGQLMLERGYAESLMGRRRRIYLVNNETQLEAMHVGMNHPVQSIASDVNLVAAWMFWKRWRHRGVWILALVHDSILAAVPEECAEEAGADLARTMEEVAHKVLWKVVHKADYKLGRSWGEL